MSADHLKLWLHTKIRWLPHDQVFKRDYELRKKVVAFLNQQNRLINQQNKLLAKCLVRKRLLQRCMPG